MIRPTAEQIEAALREYAVENMPGYYQVGGSPYSRNRANAEAVMELNLALDRPGNGPVTDEVTAEMVRDIVRSLLAVQERVAVLEAWVIREEVPQ